MAASRDKLIDAAIELILARGFSATTVDEICARAEVAKGSFYYAFSSKEELGVAALEAFDAGHQVAFASSGFLDEPDPEKRLFILLDYMISEARSLFSNGCLLGNLSLDTAEDLPLIHKRLAALFEDNIVTFEALIAECLEKAEGDGIPTPRQLSEKLATQIEGSLVLSRGTGDWDYLPRMLTLYRDELRNLIHR